ncbi:glycosyltransferase, partial [bacterium]|nr:glycosyltransferase [bacterium]
AFHLDSKIILSEAVPQNELLKYLSGGDIGVHAISNTCLNHEYCLPNKLFEYIHAGLAVLCTNLKEMSHVVRENDIGLTFQDKDPDDLASKMKHLIENTGELQRYKLNSKNLSQSMTWEHEFTVLEQLYQELLRGR